MAALVSQSDVERRCGASVLVQLLDDDRDGVADPANVSEMLDVGSRDAESIMLKAWSRDQIGQLAAEDVIVREAICDICIGWAGERKPGFLQADGLTPWAKKRERGERVLHEFASGKRRVGAEEVVGVNQTIGARVTNDVPPTFVFAATKADPRGPGGF